MKPAPFEYVRARTMDEALDHLAADPEAKALAGGQSLVPMMNMRLARPSRLVDLNRVSALAGIRTSGDRGLLIGALTRHTELVTSSVVGDRAPLLRAAAAHIGHRAVRNRGTLGGSLAHADPAAELPAAVVALGATLVVAGPSGRRLIPASDFFRGPFTTTLGPDEILVEVAVPAQRATGWAFAEVARRVGDFALAGIAGVVGGDVAPRLVAFGVDDRPVRLTAAEARLGDAPSSNVIARAAAVAADDCHPADDVHASSDYRRHLVAVLTEQVLREAAARLASSARGD